MKHMYFPLLLCCVWPAASFTYWSAFPNRRSSLQQRKLLTRDVDICIRSSRALSLIDRFGSQLGCFVLRLSHCITTLAYSEQKKMIRCDQCNYCGFLAMGGRSYKSFTNIYQVNAQYRHIILFNFIRFNFEWSSTTCNTYGVFFLSYGRNNLTLFCGKRMPWSMASHNSEITMQIRVAKYSEYELTLFYSSAHLNWMGSVSQLQSEYFTDVKVLSALSNAPYNWLSKIHIYDYFILSTPWNRLSVAVFREHVATGKLRLEVYDGPGPLASHLFEQSQFHRNQTAITSAFDSMVRLTTTHYQHVEGVVIIVKNVNLISQVKECGSGKEINFFSRGTDNIICMLSLEEVIQKHTLTFSYSFPDFYITKYIHHGFAFKVDESPYNCHYGGLYIQFPGHSHSEKSICKSIFNQRIYSRGAKIRILLVWYRKYSYGNISGFVQFTKCVTTYLESPFDNSAFLNATYRCQRVICAPLVHADQKPCTIRLGGPSHQIGVSRLIVTPMTSSSPCIPEYHNPNKEHTSNITATYTDNWPLGQRKHITLQKSIHFRIENFFEYLHYASISLPPICFKKHLLAQMGMISAVSVCRVVSEGRIAVNALENIHNVHLSCKNVVFEVRNTTVFFYKETSTPHQGLSAEPTFSTRCSEKCRNINYTLQVWKREEQKVFEYSTKFGKELFTGYYHNGFRLTMRNPDSTCISEGCTYKITFRKHGYNIGTKKRTTWTTNGHNLWTFVSKRYT